MSAAQYTILGLDRTTHPSVQQAIKSYRRLDLLYNLDKNRSTPSTSTTASSTATATAQFQLLNAAHKDILASIAAGYPEFSTPASVQQPESETEVRQRGYSRPVPKREPPVWVRRGTWEERNRREGAERNREALAKRARDKEIIAEYRKKQEAQRAAKEGKTEKGDYYSDDSPATRRTLIKTKAKPIPKERLEELRRKLQSKRQETTKHVREDGEEEGARVKRAKWEY